LASGRARSRDVAQWQKTEGLRRKGARERAHGYGEWDQGVASSSLALADGMKRPALRWQRPQHRHLQTRSPSDEG
jgi:hypothetical protein